MASFTMLSSGEIETHAIVADKLGLHARPAALIARTAQAFEAEVRLAVAGQEADAKSILDILSLSVGGGAKVAIRGHGPDAQRALEAVANLFMARFREETEALRAGEDS